MCGRWIMPGTARSIWCIVFNGSRPFFFHRIIQMSLYTAAECVFKSTDHGMSWTQISNDLTKNDKSKQQPSGGPLTNDITSVEYYDTVFALAESPKNRERFGPGRMTGWSTSRPTTAKTGRTLHQRCRSGARSRLSTHSPHDATTAYVAVDRHRLDDFKPYIFKTTDLGKSWSAITNGIPEGAYVRSVREDPKRKGMLYAGTELGVYFSLDDGAHWQPLQLNLPQSPIHDLVVKDDDLVVATHGRSFWVLDNLTPLRQLSAQSPSSDMLLYQPQTAVRLHYPEEIDKRQPAGDNPPMGAMIDYYFKSAPKDEVTLDILDAQGKLVRHLSSKEKKENEQPPEWPDRVEAPKTIPANEGMNRFAWDLRYNEPIQDPGRILCGQRAAWSTGVTGRLPGETNGKRENANGDAPSRGRSAHQRSRGELPKQFELSTQVNARISELHQAVNEIREVKSQIKELHTKFGDDLKVKPALAAADAMEHKMSDVEQQLIQVNMKGSEGNLAFPNMLNEAFDTFSRSVDAGDREPTKPQMDVFASLSGRLDEQLKKWNAIKQDDLPKVTELIKQADLPALIIKEKKSES